MCSVAERLISCAFAAAPGDLFCFFKNQCPTCIQDLFLYVVVFSVHLVTNDGKSGIGGIDGI